MKYLLILAILFSSGLANALPNYTGNIKSVLVGHQYGNSLFIEIEGNPNDKASCQTNSTFDFVLDGTTDQGKMYVSVILTAYTTQKTVYLVGYDSCSIYSGVTSFRALHIK